RRKRQAGLRKPDAGLRKCKSLLSGTKVLDQHGARPAKLRGERNQHAAFCKRRYTYYGFHHGDRSWGECTQCVGDGHRKCGEIWTIAIAPAARPSGSRVG